MADPHSEIATSRPESRHTGVMIPGGASSVSSDNTLVSSWLIPEEGALVCRGIVNPKEARH